MNKETKETKLLTDAIEVYLLQEKNEHGDHFDINDVLHCLKEATKNLMIKGNIPEWQFVRVFKLIYG